MKNLILLLALMGIMSHSRVEEVTIQELNIIYDMNTEKETGRYMVYWDNCWCDGSFHYKVRDWRRVEGNIPIKEGNRYVARFYDKKTKKEMTIESPMYQKILSFYDRESEDRKKHPESIRKKF